MKILLATGHQELDNHLKILLAQHTLEIVGDCYSRTVLVDVAQKLKADTVIISSLLEGQIILSELIKNLRGIGLRVVVLPGSLDMDDTKELVIDLVPYGVYDFVYDELTPEDILNRLKNPATLNDVPSELAKAAMDNQKVSQEVNKQIQTQIKTQKRVQPTKEKPSFNRLSSEAKEVKKQRNIILATGDDAINESIATSVDLGTLISLNREDLIQKIANREAEVVVISPGLPGEADILEVVFQVKQVTTNVIFIAGHITPTNVTIQRIRELDVEVLTGEIRIGTILRALYKMLGDSEQECNLVYDEPIDEGEGSLSKIVRVSTDIAKNLTNQVSKIQLKKKKHTLNEKVITVVSTVPAGKTFVAVNLAIYLAQWGLRTCLVDGDPQQSTHTWLSGQQDEDSLMQAMDTDEPIMAAYQPLPMVPNLYVLNKDPFVDTQSMNLKNFIKLLDKLNESEDIDTIIVDTSRNIAESKPIIEVAATVILVADQDFSHLLKLQADIDKLENDFDFNKFSLLVNRVVDSQNLEISDAEKSVGLQADGVISERTKEVLESIKSGIPVALFCPEIRESFEEFWAQKEKLRELA